MSDLPGSCGFRGIYDGFSDGTAGVEGIDVPGSVIGVRKSGIGFLKTAGSQESTTGFTAPLPLGWSAGVLRFGETAVVGCWAEAAPLRGLLACEME